MESVPSPHSSVLDEETFLQSTMGDARLARMVVDAFLQSTPGLLSLCRERRDSGELAEARRAIHTVKGSALTLGLNRLAQMCRRVEIELAAGNMAIDHALAEAAALFETSRTVLEEALSRLES